MWFPLSRNFSLPQVVSKLSVRGRIAAIAVIPVVGFLAIGSLRRSRRRQSLSASLDDTC